MNELIINHIRISDNDAHYLILAGPTAVGKTALVESIAEQVRLEIVSADSRQIYQGMNIGTATPDAELLKRIPHHLVNELAPDITWNAGTFYRQARKHIEDILARNALPVVVGGAGLYLEALQYGLFGEFDKSEKIRKKYQKILMDTGAEALWQQLFQLDPEYAETFHFNDHKKLIRAFEIYESNGVIPSEAFSRGNDPFNLKACFVVLDRDREILYKRINQRVEEMLKAGLLNECQALIDSGYSSELYPLRTIGYKEVFNYFDGLLSHEEMVEAIKKNTRNFAKRQLTWFRNHTYDFWLTLDN